MENKDVLLNIFGAKVSKDGNKLVLTLVSGENDKKRYYNTCIKLDNSQSTKVELIDEYAVIKVKLLKQKEQDTMDDVTDDDLPF